MKVLKKLYEKMYHKSAPYYLDYSPITLILKPIRKWLTNSVAANCPFNCIRIGIYRMCGFSIGKGTFIGMRCYLDDMCYDMLKIGNNCTISYGVFFACHGRKQQHTPIHIKDGAYIGMRANVISGKKGVTIGENAVIGACTLVNKDIPDNVTVVGVPCRKLENSENAIE